jgi:predicted RNA-binding Zn-ribbon protein involved in translation (DUF1610 family)
MAIDQESYEAYTPCPQCGSEKLIERQKQENKVVLEDGGPEMEIIPRHTETVEMLCPECDETIWERE